MAVVNPTPRPSASATPVAKPEPSPGAAPIPRPSASATSSPNPPAAAEREARSIAREIAALDLVRQALARGDVARARADLERYGRAYPRGVLAQEAGVLEIEALWRAGQRGQARALARRFARAHPGSPHLERIRALTGGDRDGSR